MFMDIDKFVEFFNNEMEFYVKCKFDKKWYTTITIFCVNENNLEKYTLNV